MRLLRRNTDLIERNHLEGVQDADWELIEPPAHQGFLDSLRSQESELRNPSVITSEVSLGSYGPVRRTSRRSWLGGFHKVWLFFCKGICLTALILASVALLLECISRFVFS